MGPASSPAPTYPVRKILTEEEAARARPLQLLRVGAHVFAQLPHEWALVDAASNDVREVDDA